MHPFPEQATDDRAAGDAVVAELSGLLRARVDPTAVDDAGRLPDGLVAELGARGYLGLRLDPALGGRGLSFLNAFRAIETAASWSMPVAFLLAVQNGLGAGAYLSLLPAGPLRDLVTRHVAAGSVFADADTEPRGAANDLRATRATPVDGGRAYRVQGEKICIGNGPIADLVLVSATVADAGRERVGLFFVDTRSPGFGVRSLQDFMGLRGASVAALTLDGVRVPREHAMIVPEHDRSARLDLSLLVHRGRMLLIAATSLAAARLCAHWMREFIGRRSVNGRGLGTYDEVRWMVAESIAEIFAIESLSEWCLLAGEHEDPLDHRLAMYAAKNVSSVTCWRLIDRTMSLLAAEGFETASSKARRGAQPLPLERFFRDARALRIAGGVDFQVDNWAAQLGLLPCYYPESDGARQIEPDGLAFPDDPGLSSRNRDHLRFAAQESRRLARTCRRLSRRYPGLGEIVERERTVIFLNRVVNELLTMSIVLSRASHLASRGLHDAQDLADVFCTGARHRLAGCWRRIAEERGADHAGAAARWLDGEMGFLLRDVILEAPPA